MTSDIKKSYMGISDAQMLEEAQTMLDLYTADLARFTAFDISLNATFEAEVQAQIDAAIDFPTDDTINFEIEELTVEVKKTWQACCQHFQQAKYFIIKAFPGNQARHHSFGFTDYMRMFRTQNAVIEFMDQFAYRCVKHSAALITAGYTQDEIDAITTLSEAYRTANLAQEIAKKDRYETTRERTITMNTVWKAIKSINSASKIIYLTNPAKLQQFLMPAAGSNQPAQDLALTGTIISTATNLPQPGVTVTLTTHNLTSITDRNGRYGFTQGIPTGETPLQATAPGFATLQSTVTLIANTTITLNLQITPG